MSLTSRFLTIPRQRELAIASVTSEATGHPIEYAFDQNLNTYWEPTSNASQSIVLDLQTTQIVNGLAMFVRNYDIDFTAGSLFYYVEYSDTGTSGPWTSVRDMSMLMADYFTVGKPLTVGPVGSDQTHRYWRIRSVFISDLPQISQFFLYRARSIVTPDAYPHNDKRIYAHSRISGPGGRMVRSPINRVPVYDRARTWQTATSADASAIQGAFDDCAGRANLCIYDPSDGDPEVIEFANKKFRLTQTLQGVYSASLSWKTVPYIEASEVF